MKLFGFKITRDKPEKYENVLVQPFTDDGSINTTSTAGAYFTQIVDLDTNIKNENQLIVRYRELSMLPEVNEAIREIVNESISYSNDGEIVYLNLDKLDYSKNIKSKILEEFENIQELFSFKSHAPDLFLRWYVDGRIYFLVNLNMDNPKEGITSIVPIEARNIRKIRNIEKEVDRDTGVEVIKKIEEYFIFNEYGIEHSSTKGVKLSADSVIFVTSGFIDANSGITLSHLHKAIKAANQLKMMEDGLVIYRISRAPERRVFYIDPGSMPKLKAEQYLVDVMNKFRNRIAYDPSTGEIRDGRRHLSMIEDFWLLRRDGSKGTQIETLPGGQNLGQMEDVEYFRNKLYQSLNVPITRLMPQNNFSLGRTNEITRDELKFSKFIDQLRYRFNQILLDALRIQLIAKNIISPEEWEENKKFFKVENTTDNNFRELKDAELLQNRISALGSVDSYVGKWFSKRWAQKNILQLSDEQIEQIEAEMKEEKEKEPQDITQSTSFDLGSVDSVPKQTDVALEGNEQLPGEQK